MKPLVSIIIPVYNAQNCIAQCIESILNQTYSNFECIIIDDGSKDESGNICDEYASKDARIRVIHKENSGVSDTRNLALKLAKGEYLQFVDADDWLTNNATETLVNAMVKHDCELVISDFYRVVDSKVSSKGSIKHEGILSLKEFAFCLMENPADFYYGVLWNKLFKKSLIDEYQLIMDPNISWSEDFIFNLRYLEHVNHIYVSQTPIYYYVKTKNSLVSQANLEKTVQMKINVFEYYDAFFTNVLSHEEYKKNRMAIYRFLIDFANDAIVLPFENKPIVHHVQTTLEDNYFEMNLLNQLAQLCYKELCEEYKLNLYEIQILQYLNKNRYLTPKSLSKKLGCSTQKASFCLQNLKLKDLITWNEVKVVLDNGKKKNVFEYHILSNALIIIDKAKKAQYDFFLTCFENFSYEEIELYNQLNNKLKQNLNKITHQ